MIINFLSSFHLGVELKVMLKGWRLGSYSVRVEGVK
jgi:hypothetical protein